MSRGIAILALLIVLLSNVPQFLCMPLTPDTIIWDLQTKNIFRGGVLYRDIFEPNLPGTAWVHMAIRSTLGWRSEAMRLADLVIFSTIVLLLARWIHRLGRGPSIPIWTAAALFLFYFSLSEWSHCQRDMWMLFFALCALSLRVRQIRRLSRPDGRATAILSCATLEGIVWGAAFWIKPFVAIPATLCWVASTVSSRRAHVLLFDAFGMLLGGLLIGAAGTLWMWKTGAWPYFEEILLEWNPEYFQFRKKSQQLGIPRVLLEVLGPWFAAHLVAIPTAITTTATALTRSVAGKLSAEEHACAMLSSLYLGWLVQAFLFQQAHAYVHAPAVVLAMAVLGGHSFSGRSEIPKAIIVFLLICLSLGHSPALRTAWFKAWPACLQSGSTPAVCDSLFRGLDVVFPANPHSEDLDRIARFLRSRDVRDGELTCFNFSVMSLYCELDVRPPCRFVCPQVYPVYFPSHVEEIQRSLAESDQRFVVTDLAMSGMAAEYQGTEVLRSTAPGSDVPRVPANIYPWSLPVVFRAGRYLVHEVQGPIGAIAPSLSPWIQAAERE